MTDLFKQISDIRPRLHGWATLHKCHTLATAVIALRPEVVVELGVWGGASLLPMAMACKTLGRGTVVGIDPWSASVSKSGQEAANEQWWGAQDHEAIYNIFRKEVELLDVANHVCILRMASDEADVPATIGILHSDGNHGPQALRDVERFAPNVVIGGLVVLDDLHWSGGHVSRAAERLCELGFQELYRMSGNGDDWAMYQRTK